MRLIRESINFQRGVQPKEAMKTGAEAELHEYALRWWDADNIEDNLEDLLDQVLEDKELDKDIKKSFITILLQKISFDNLTENNVIGLHDEGINLIPFLKKQPKQTLKGSIELIIQNNKYFIDCADWEDFTEIMDYDKHNVSEEFIEGVLSGDAYEFFMSDHYYDVYDRNFDVSLQKDLSEYEDIYQYAKKIDPTFKVENASELMEKIWEKADEDDRFEKLKHAIIKAYGETEESANEYEAFKDITEAVMNNFEMEYLKNKSGKTLLFSITERGLNDLVYACLHTDYNYEYRIPQGGEYYGDWDEDVFIDCLNSNIDWMEK